MTGIQSNLHVRERSLVACVCLTLWLLMSGRTIGAPSQAKEALTKKAKEKALEWATEKAGMSKANSSIVARCISSGNLWSCLLDAATTSSVAEAPETDPTGEPKKARAKACNDLFERSMDFYKKIAAAEKQASDAGNAEDLRFATDNKKMLRKWMEHCVKDLKAMNLPNGTKREKELKELLARVP